jgi:hypothetical protein
MSDGAKPAVKKRKAAAGAAASPAAGSKKLANGIGSLLARLEATNASFLHTAATNAMHTQLAKVCVQGKFADGLLPPPPTRRRRGRAAGAAAGPAPVAAYPGINLFLPLASCRPPR